MSEKDFGLYKVKKINDRTWCIVENNSVAMYVLEGDDKAVLVDTGWGIGNLAELVGTITKLPLSVILTHGHPDHVCGAYQFPQVYIAKHDEHYLQMYYNDVIRTSLLEDRLRDSVPEDLPREKWIDAKLGEVGYLGDDDFFELGGRTLRIIAMPGHTPGSICILDDSDGILLSGDSIQVSPILMLQDTALTLRQYFYSLQNIEKHKERFSMILPGHGESPIGIDVVEDLMAGVAAILDGRMVGELQQTFFGEGLVCKFDKITLIYKSDNL